ncbi:hypothetical protein ACE1CI_15215 [Aerosakkonemataceae cyanobacterium BLCC-F50]|uniref:Uncharacterized protein n=1 Tax=Floridaenema flaviceps BLCC-F50 TaxID=3153642 RepID=A0ABV4XSM1_9CYAN
MGQSLHFYRIKYDPQFIESSDIETILRKLKEELKSKLGIDEITYDSFFEPIEEISLYLSADDPKFEKLLGTGAKNLLHPNSRCYLVTEDLWKVIEEMILQMSNKLKSSDRSQETSEEYLKDRELLKKMYDKKILMVEAS